MKINYIYHSGFAIEDDTVTVIIDYYKDSSEKNENKGIVHDYILKKEGIIYVLSTHFHPDHFNREILSWRQIHPNIRYIFSKDILKHRRASSEEATFLHKGEQYQDEHICIETFGSTDSGVSFLITLRNKRLFHAGDLNNWHWKDNSTPAEIRKAEGDFLAELKFLKQKYPQIDIVMFPVDKRIGQDYMLGAQQFIEQIKTGIFIPMHFGNDYAGGNAFQSFAQEHGCLFFNITHRGESLDIL